MIRLQSTTASWPSVSRMRASASACVLLPEPSIPDSAIRAPGGRSGRRTDSAAGPRPAALARRRSGAMPPGSACAARSTVSAAVTPQGPARAVAVCQARGSRASTPSMRRRCLAASGARTASDRRARMRSSSLGAGRTSRGRSSSGSPSASSRSSSPAGRSHPETGSTSRLSARQPANRTHSAPRWTKPSAASAASRPATAPSGTSRSRSRPSGGGEPTTSAGRSSAASAMAACAAFERTSGGTRWSSTSGTRYSAFVLRIATGVRMRILRSSQSDQFWMYQLSQATRSASDVCPRRPLICAQPVMPGLHAVAVVVAADVVGEEPDELRALGPRADEVHVAARGR